MNGMPKDNRNMSMLFSVLFMTTIYDVSFLWIMATNKKTILSMLALFMVVIISWILFIVQKTQNFSVRVAVVFCMQVELFIFSTCILDINEVLPAFYIMTILVAMFGVPGYLLYSLINYLSICVYYIIFVYENVGLTVLIKDLLPKFQNVIIYLGIIYFWLKMRNKNEIAIRKNVAKLIQSEKEKEGFIISISRYIKNPLINILLFCNNIKKKNDIKEVYEDNKKINLASLEMMNIVEAVLYYSEIVDNTMTIERNNYKLTDMLNDVFDYATTRKDKKNIEFIVNIDSDLPKELVGDVDKIKKIINIIIGNSLKSTDSGYISINIGGRKERYGWNLKIDINDTGSGIDEDTLEIIMESSNKINLENNVENGIINITMSICKMMVTKMGGAFICKSEKNKGTSVQIVIPQHMNGVDKIIETDRILNKKILIYVDFEKFTRIELRDAYKNNMYNIVEQLNISGHICSDIDEFNRYVEKGDFTHIITMLNTYKEHKEYFDSLAEIFNIIVVVEQLSNIPNNKDIKCIYKPFHIFNVYSAIMDDVQDMNSDEKEKMMLFYPNDVLDKKNVSESAKTNKDLPKKNDAKISKDLPKKDEVKNKVSDNKAAENKNDDIKKQTLVIGTLDTQSAILYCGGEKSYIRILKNFVAGADNTKNEIEGFFEQKEWKDYTIKVHALKSSMLSMGAKELSDKAKQLEMAAKEQRFDYIEENHAMVMEDYDKVVAMMKSSSIFEQENKEKKNSKEVIVIKNITKEKLIELVDSFENYSYDWNSSKMKEILMELRKYGYNNNSFENELVIVDKKIEEDDLLSASQALKDLRNNLIGGDKNA